MLNRRLALLGLLSAAVLILSSCQYLAPSDDHYEVGVARIGDTVYVFAPMCATERVASVEAYDNKAAGKEKNYDPATMKFTYWKVADPAEEATAKGWITIGDDSA